MATLNGGTPNAKATHLKQKGLRPRCAVPYLDIEKCPPQNKRGGRIVRADRELGGRQLPSPVKETGTREGPRTRLGSEEDGRGPPAGAGRRPRPDEDPRGLRQASLLPRSLRVSCHARTAGQGRRDFVCSHNRADHVFSRVSAATSMVSFYGKEIHVVVSVIFQFSGWSGRLSEIAHRGRDGVHHSPSPLGSRDITRVILFETS